MSGIVVLDEVELIPVVELAPVAFATQERTSPSRSFREVPEEWHRYWLDSVADSGLTGLTPVQRGSWHVPTTEFADPDRLRRLLEVIFREEGGIRSLPDPEDVLPLNGGLALSSPSQGVAVEPTCCADLGNVADWRHVVECREAVWQTLWIGHPWLSVMFQAPRLMISEPHESETPIARWALVPEQLERALVTAEAELERLAERIAAIPPLRDYGGDPKLMGRRLAGLADDG
jgi:hypothetical protein